eukprot:SAG31_NODE_158_length_21979_cov_6.851691_3_plen_66_part_00
MALAALEAAPPLLVDCPHEAQGPGRIRPKIEQAEKFISVHNTPQSGVPFSYCFDTLTARSSFVLE